MYRSKLLFGFLFCFSLTACRKKELPASSPNPSNTGSINIKLNNVVGSKALGLGELVSYTLSNGETFTVKTYNYYLSNFVFTDENGNKFIEPESYHLAMASDTNSLQFVIAGLPTGQYSTLEFLIGVDSVRNFSGAQSGALDPKYGMIWSWSTGYIMAKMEGYSPQSPNPDKSISYHIAGYKGAYNTLQKVKINLSQKVTIVANKASTISMQSNLATWFESFTFLGFSKLPSIGSEGLNAYNIALNYSSMMSVTKVENP
ncbi:MAG: hypothetical protein QM530_06050 [Phycisphaerales bacterium]|nr:hypothetical protein [Phycisphaerales bacterium]